MINITGGEGPRQESTDFLLSRDVCQRDLLFLDQRKRGADLQVLVVLEITIYMEDARAKSQECTSDQTKKCYYRMQNAMQYAKNLT